MWYQALKKYCCISDQYKGLCTVFVIIILVQFFFTDLKPRNLIPANIKGFTFGFETANFNSSELVWIVKTRTKIPAKIKTFTVVHGNIFNVPTATHWTKLA